VAAALIIGLEPDSYRLCSPFAPVPAATPIGLVRDGRRTAIVVAPAAVRYFTPVPAPSVWVCVAFEARVDARYAALILTPAPAPVVVAAPNLLPLPPGPAPATAPGTVACDGS
jgi:hypothetical protein